MLKSAKLVRFLSKQVKVIFLDLQFVSKVAVCMQGINKEEVHTIISPVNL